MKTRSLKFLLLINGKIPCTCIHVNNYLSVTMGDYGKLHYKSFSVESDVNELKENQEANRRKIESIYSSIQYQKCANILGFLTLLFSSGFISYLYLQINGFDPNIQEMLEMEDSQIEDHQHDYTASYIINVY